MRRTAAALATTALLVGAVPPAHAEDSVVVVHGIDPYTDDTDSLEFLLRSCADPTAPADGEGPPPVHISYTTDDPPIGLRAHGFHLSGVGAVGPLAYTPTPSTSVWRMRVSSTSVGTHGYAVAYYLPPGEPGNRYWVGYEDVAYGGSAWQTADARGLSLTWTEYEPWGPATGATGNGTLAAFTATHGGDGDAELGTGAYLGFILGCDASRFYFDGLQVGPPGDTTTYDFEGALSQATMQSAGSTIRAGRTVELAGLPHPEDLYSSIELVLQARPFGAAEFTEVGRADSVFDDGEGQQLPATLIVEPMQRTEYRWVVEDSSTTESSTSDVVVVEVRPRVGLALTDSTLRRGQTLVAQGSTTPAKATVGVRLERLVDGSWRTLVRGVTKGDGRYKLAAPAKKKGVWKVRVVVDAADGNLSGTSPTRKATVR